VHILKETGIDWRERRLFGTWYMDRRNYDWTTGTQKSVTTVNELNNDTKDAVFHRFRSTYRGSTIPRKLLRHLETSRGKNNNSHCEILMTLCCWLRKKSMTGHDRYIIGVGSRYVMEMNVEKTEVMIISRQSFPLQTVIDQKPL